MAIKQVKIGETVHDIQTTIANVDGLQNKLDEMQDEMKLEEITSEEIRNLFASS